MTIDKERILKQLQEMAQNAKVSEYPKFFDDERFEDAFLVPETDEEGYSESIPAIYGDYGYGKYSDGVLFITLKSASLETCLYSKYLDSEALVWDSISERLLLYVPDPTEPKIAFKGSRWQFAKRLKPEFEDYITLRDVYYEYLENLK